MSKCIITVDDSSTVRQMVAFSLENEGYDVIQAEDGVDALKKVGTKNVHMVITDLDMPNMDGIELIRSLRADHRYRFVPIVTLTAEWPEMKKREGKEAGATGWIVKPFNPEQLINVVK